MPHIADRFAVHTQMGNVDAVSEKAKMMTQFPAIEAKVAYDHLTFRSTIEVLRAETRLDWNELWTRVREQETMGRVAQAMLRAAASELCLLPLPPQEVRLPDSDSTTVSHQKPLKSVPTKRREGE